MKYSLEKWGAPRTYYFRRARRALIILGARRAPIILGGLDEHPFLRGREQHPLFQGGTPAPSNVALLDYSFVHNNNCPVRTLKHLMHKNCIHNNLAKVT